MRAMHLPHSGLLGQSPAMATLRERMQRLLAAEHALREGAPPTVLIEGETGAGKQVVARALHDGGPRAGQPFVELNCGALPSHLVEAELFGYERGAFTDARERKRGLVEAADGGTLFLDEIGEAEPATQVKLLKLLEDRRFRRLGALQDQAVDLRVICATHRSLPEMVARGEFRADLYYRLRVLSLRLPPLRERAADIVLLARHHLQDHARRYARTAPAFTACGHTWLQAQPWPGNVRELRHAMEQVILMHEGDTVDAAALQSLLAGPHDMQTQAPSPTASIALTDDLNLARQEQRLIEAALARRGHNVTQAAQLLGISRDTLRYRLQRQASAG